MKRNRGGEGELAVADLLHPRGAVVAAVGDARYFAIVRRVDGRVEPDEADVRRLEIRPADGPRHKPLFPIGVELAVFRHCAIAPAPSVAVNGWRVVLLRAASGACAFVVVITVDRRRRPFVGL